MIGAESWGADHVTLSCGLFLLFFYASHLDLHMVTFCAGVVLSPYRQASVQDPFTRPHTTSATTNSDLRLPKCRFGVNSGRRATATPCLPLVSVLRVVRCSRGSKAMSISGDAMPHSLGAWKSKFLQLPKLHALSILVVAVILLSSCLLGYVARYGQQATAGAFLHAAESVHT
ncbi:hypothetical protein V8C35DRAFT_30773 [Trichoderma chlorosporum]